MLTGSPPGSVLVFKSPAGRRVPEGEMVRSANDPAKKPRNRSGVEENRNEKNVGDALRRVYSETVDEEIPDDLLDLLNKLG